MNNTTTTRINWIDCAKGIGIILVVLGHSERGLVSAGIAPESWKLGLDYYLYTFHMPLFVFLAGLNVPKSIEKGRQQFLIKKIPTIVWPYFLWSIFLGVSLALMSSYTNGSGKWSDILSIGWRPLGPFWFLYTLFIYCVIATVMLKRPYLLASLSLMLFVLSENFSRDSLAQSISHFLIFYVAGIFLSPIMLLKKISQPWRLFLASGASWLIFTALISTRSNYDYFSSIALPSAALGSAMLIFMANGIKGPLRALFCELGTASMPIYVMHILATAGVRILINKINPDVSPKIHLLAGTFFGVIIPYTIYLIVKKLNWMPIFGFGKNPA